MTILFDLLGAQPNVVGSKFHGGGEYSKTVFKALIECISDQTIIIFFDPDKFLDGWILSLIQEKSIKVFHIKEYLELNEIFNIEKIDVYFSGMPYAVIENVIPDNVRKIGTFHGLRSVECPTDFFEYKYKKGIKALKAVVKPLFREKLRKKALLSYEKIMRLYDDIVCVSNHTKYAMANFYPELKKRPSVFYTPAKYLGNCIDNDVPMVKDKYILLLGLNRWEKNGCRGIAAIEGLIDKGLLRDYRVVTIGEIPKKVQKVIKHKEYYVTYGYVEPKELENLYANCDFFLYPSLNEGFGMPPLEAMRYGKTCIVSGVCSLPEVCGDAVYYCNPYDIEEIQNRILMACEKKIDKNKVLQHFQKILDRQNEDLLALCHYILGA